MTNTSTTTEPQSLHCSANFAAKRPTGGQRKLSSENPVSIGYDHEAYLQLTGGGEMVQKTPNQVYREERARHLKTRANDPAISDPQGDPSPVDFECVEIRSRASRS